MTLMPGLACSAKQSVTGVKRFMIVKGLDDMLNLDDVNMANVLGAMQGWLIVLTMTLIVVWQPSVLSSYLSLLP